MTNANSLEIITTSKQMSKIKDNEVQELIEKSLLSIRVDLQDDPYILETLRVLPVGGFRSAIGAFWNAVVDDLRKKIMYRSLRMFNKESEIGREIKNYEDFQNFVNDDQLIDGAYKIGVIGWEASKVLKHAKETRHIFSGHPSSTDPSIIKVFSMMDDCIKYVLNVEYPQQIIDLSNYMEVLATEAFDRNSIGVETAFGDLPERYKNELVNRLFRAYIHHNSSTIMRSNIEFCAPILWNILPKPIKIQIARKIDQEIINGDGAIIDLAFQFIENVQGYEYLTLSAKKYKIEPLISELEENLDTFSIENRCVEELERFSNSIPIEFLGRYVNSLTQTYIGHTGGSAYYSRTDFYADRAGLKIPEMFEKFDDTAADAFIKSIKTNKKVKARINSPAKLRRLRSLANIVLERVSINYHNKDFLEALTDETRDSEFFESL